jgi:FtsP/CotA-like multicopper oxidase with cupredoxin domain
MNTMTTTQFTLPLKFLALAGALTATLLAAPTQAAVPGITGPTFALTASATYSNQPDGAQIYSWGYGCTKPAANCPQVQLPGPTLIVTQGDSVTVTLTNSLPAVAGNTSILFPGFQVCPAALVSGSCPSTLSGIAGRLTQEAAPGGTVTYTFVASNPGTYAYYSGTQPELQVEMGMVGAIIVVPNKTASNYPTSCNARKVQGDMRLATAAYDHPDSCYDREYLFQLSEMDSRIHAELQTQADACPTAPCPAVTASFEPYHPNYFLINGRSMPDLMDSPFAPAYPNQPYNGNPHMHPGELVLMRIIGQGHWQHPFHFHGNHARVLARECHR